MTKRKTNTPKYDNKPKQRNKTLDMKAARKKEQKLAKITAQDLFNSYAAINDEQWQKDIEKSLRSVLTKIYKKADEQDAVKIWVDGSYNAKSGISGIGIVIITDDNYGLDNIHNKCFGKTINAKSSVKAEIYALSVGLSYVLDTFPNVNDVHVYYDCMNSIMCATNIDAFTSLGVPYTNFKSALKRIRKRKMNVVFEHTKAHASDINNELCDMIAKYYANAKLQSSQKKYIEKYIEKGEPTLNERTN